MKTLILFALLSTSAFANEKVCVKYENVEIEECTSTRGRNAIGGALLGGLGGYLLGGKRGAGWGAGGGALVGAASGDKKCTIRKERHCSEWKTLGK